MDQTTRYKKALLENDAQVIEEIYRNNFPKIQSMVSRDHGSEEDAWDIFQESIMVIYDKIKEDRVDFSVNLEAYLIGVARNLWLKLRSKKYQKEVSFPENLELIDSTSLEKDIQTSAQYQFYRIHFARLSERCQQMLSLFFQKLKMTEIAVQMGFENDNVAKKEKSKCQKKLLENIMNDPEYHQHL